MIYFLVTSASVMSSNVFPIWLGIGALIYFHYGYKMNRKKEAKVKELRMNAIKKVELRNLENDAK